MKKRIDKRFWRRFIAFVFVAFIAAGALLQGLAVVTRTSRGIAIGKGEIYVASVAVGLVLAALIFATTFIVYRRFYYLPINNVHKTLTVSFPEGVVLIGMLAATTRKERELLTRVTNSSTQLPRYFFHAVFLSDRFIMFPPLSAEAAVFDFPVGNINSISTDSVPFGLGFTESIRIEFIGFDLPFHFGIAEPSSSLIPIRAVRNPRFAELMANISSTRSLGEKRSNTDE